MPAKRYVPAYEAVADDIRRKIESGEWEPGTQLPFRRKLQEIYSVSGGVIDSAMIVLRNEGLVEGRQGKGVYVAEP